ncbi:MAG: ABC transporter ATP-binding protein [Lachnospiraceae bacterium]|nr:ABC transporter ATP-binding protein [Lachnospiraceae bacterium]
MKKRFQTRLQLVSYIMQGSKRFFGLAVFFVCLLVLFELVNPKIIGYAVDFIIGDESTIPAFLLSWIEQLGGREYALSHLYIFALVIVGIALFGGVCRYLFRLFNSMGAEKLVKRMRDVLYGHISRLPFAWHDGNRTGDIIQRCTSDVDMIKNYISEQMTNLFRMIVMIILALVFMSRIHVLLTIVAAAFIPIVVGYSFLFHDKIGSSFERVDNEEGKLSAIVQENLTGVRVVRAFGREKYERDRFEKKNSEYTGMWVHMMRILSIFWVTNDIISGVEVLTVLVLGAYFTIRGDLSAGSYVAFLSYNGLLTFPVRQLGRVVSEMSKAGISMDRILYILNSPEEQDAADAVDYPGNGDIVFDHVSFSYDSQSTNTQTQVLQDISFTIGKGQTVGILGGTGSGKSTLIHILDALYELPAENRGAIYLNGVELGKIKKRELREHIGMVLQEPYLFSGTLEDNIKIARDEATHKEVEEVVDIASLSGSIARFAEGYQTYVGERGVTLSGGQKQRTAIAQMLIRRPDIMIFDDSLSAVDSQTDARIRAGLKKAAGASTVLLISHRITTLMQADHIIVLDCGRIVEQGTHEQLLGQGGVYKQIYDLQVSQGKEENA